MDNVEVNLVRMFFYETIKNAFYNEPEEDFFKIIKDFITNLKENNDFDNEDINLILNSFETVFDSYEIQDVKDEYYNLFIDPFSENLVNKNASHYLDNKDYGNTLVNVRDFIWKLKTEKDGSFKEPEDSVSFLSDYMMYLIKNEDTEKTLELQKDFFSDFIEPMYLNLSETLKANPKAVFYACISLLMDYFLDLEKGYLNTK
jgi:TorA maturation chaperone TorD